MTGRLTGTAAAILTHRAACEAAIGELADRAADAGVVQRLREQIGRDLAGIVLSVAALQPKAKQKLAGPDAGDRVWWVTDKSLQQATGWQVARLKSSWLTDRVTYDLCCGIGGDSLQLAKTGRVVAVEWDEITAAMASANLQSAGFAIEHAKVELEDVTKIDIPVAAAVHIDPDRRARNARTSQPQLYQPAWTEVRRIIQRAASALVKLAPAARVDHDDADRMHRCWIALAGSVREQSLLCGEAIDQSGLSTGTKSAVSLNRNAGASWFAPGRDEIEHAKADCAKEPGSLLVDPDASIRAAGLTESFACHHRCKTLGNAAGFLTAEEFDPEEPMAVVGRVIWSGSCDDRKLRRELRNRNCYPSVIKVRGSDHDPNALVRRYRNCGDRGVTLWIGRRADRIFAALTE